MDPAQGQVSPWPEAMEMVAPKVQDATKRVPTVHPPKILAEIQESEL
jgi:hypothetical protein